MYPVAPAQLTATRVPHHRSVEQFEQDTFLPDAREAFAERAAEAYDSGLDKNEELLVRDSTTNPRVLEYRVNQSLVRCVTSNVSRECYRR